MLNYSKFLAEVCMRPTLIPDEFIMISAITMNANELRRG